MSETLARSALARSEPAAIRVAPVTSRAERAAFLDLPYRAYRGDPAWRAPLRMERADQLDPAKNSALDRMEIQLFLAWKDDRPAGRIAAFVNRAHLERHDDGAGHFGFLDTIEPDFEVMQALIAAAEDWLAGQGMETIAGPYNFSVNEECGLLVDGFDSPPMIMMPHGRPDYAAGLEALGFAKAMDIHAYLCDMGPGYRVPRAVERMKTRFERDAGLEIRPMNPADFENEVALVMDIFNDAWSSNWGFVPFEDAEIRHMAKALKPLIRPDGLWIGTMDGEPVFFTWMIPNLNEAIHGLDGRLLPFGWAQLLYRLKIAGLRSGRIPLAGGRKSVQKNPRGLYLASAVFEACMEAQYRRGVREVEFSWVLETNADLIHLISLYEGRRYKTYRLYDKPLDSRR